MSRRSFLVAGAGVALSPWMVACGSTGPAEDVAPIGRRLAARPGVPTMTPVLGESALGLETGRDGLLFVPANYDPAVPLPLLVFMHGATSSATGFDAHPFGLMADGLGAVVLIPESRDITWDLILSRFGWDVPFVDRALAHTFERCAIDPTRIALAGFSDGATYALSLGVSNGDLFTHVIGFSPGGIERSLPLGLPQVFVSHGWRDSILPVRTSRENIVPSLRAAGYSVVYEEFDGGHTMPDEVVTAAMEWWLEPAPTP